ncbi:MAG: hypothetical protein A6F72_02820 [Cycloclasticus sp. symbiont of Poecilosclerida sp. N]|nr:MAG: hypothetical protein A6F72_02820 [Cycloclasticus sp. symbiont of Poecilosclerida sp. N]
MVFTRHILIKFIADLVSYAVSTSTVSASTASARTAGTRAACAGGVSASVAAAVSTRAEVS